MIHSGRGPLCFPARLLFIAAPARTFPIPRGYLRSAGIADRRKAVGFIAGFAGAKRAVSDWWVGFDCREGGAGINNEKRWWGGGDGG